MIHNKSETRLKINCDDSVSLHGDKSCSCQENSEHLQPDRLTIDMLSDASMLVNCRTEEDAIYFCRWLDLHNKRWSSGDSYSKYNYWFKFKSETCYHVVLGSYGRLSYFSKNNRKKVVQFNKSMIKNDSVWMQNDPFCYVQKSSNPTAKVKRIPFGNVTTRVNLLDVISKSSEDEALDLVRVLVKYFVSRQKHTSNMARKSSLHEEFFPQKLISALDTCLDYGDIGEKTPFSDVLGRPLHVGDIVEVWNDRKYLDTTIVVKTAEVGYFILGIQDYCCQNGDFSGGYKILLKDNCSEIS